VRHPCREFFISYLHVHSIHFDVSVDFANEPEASEESNRPSYQEKYENHNQRVAEIQNSRDEAADGQFSREVMDAVAE